MDEEPLSSSHRTTAISSCQGRDRIGGVGVGSGSIEVRQKNHGGNHLGILVWSLEVPDKVVRIKLQQH